jgi:hypothetical protein
MTFETPDLLVTSEASAIDIVCNKNIQLRIIIQTLIKH